MSNSRKIILTAGPVAVPEAVNEALRQPPLHHRSAEFEAVLVSVRAQLARLLGASGKILLTAGSGTYVMQMAMRSLIREGDQVLCVVNGKFSDRWAVFARAQDWSVDSLRLALGAAPEMSHLQKAATAAPNAVVLTHCETSTGALTDLEDLAWQVRGAWPDCLIIVDAISTVGSLPLYVDHWSLDAVVTASQKGLMCPPGLGICHLSKRAQARLRDPGFKDAFHLHTYSQSLPAYPFTPPTQIIQALDIALSMILEEGLANRWNRVHHVARTLKAGLVELGASLLSAVAGDPVVAFRLPGHEPEAVRAHLLREFGFELSAGQGELKGKVLRIGNYGEVSFREYARLLDVLRAIL